MVAIEGGHLYVREWAAALQLFWSQGAACVFGQTLALCRIMKSYGQAECAFGDGSSPCRGVLQQGAVQRIGINRAAAQLAAAAGHKPWHTYAHL